MGRREIKFRCWDRFHKQMRYSFDGWEDSVDVLKDVWEYICATYDVMQYTGLRDKNLREVYEGDIIREGGRVAVIQWDSDDARFLYRTETTTAGLYLFNGEVIGNIYEHKHLLREEG